MNSRRWPFVLDVLTLLLWVVAVILIFGCDDVDRESWESQVDTGPERLAVRWANDLGLPLPRVTCVAIVSLGIQQATHRCDVLIYTNKGPVIYLLDCDRSACIHRVQRREDFQ